MIDYKQILSRQARTAHAVLVIIGVYLVSLNLLEPKTLTGFILGLIFASLIYFIVEAFVKGFWGRMSKRREIIRLLK